MDKKLRFQFDDDNDASISEKNDLEFPNFKDDLSCGDGYETDEAPEATNLITQLQSQPSASFSEQASKQNVLEALNKAALDYHADLMYTANDQPNRAQELLDQVLSAHKYLTLTKHSNIHQISEFKAEKSKKRSIEKQVRRSPKRPTKKRKP